MLNPPESVDIFLIKDPFPMICLGWLRPRSLWTPSLRALAQGLGGNKDQGMSQNQGKSEGVDLILTQENNVKKIRSFESIFSMLFAF